MIENLQQLEKYAEALKKPKSGYRILVSLGTCGIAAGTNPVREAFAKEINSYPDGTFEIVDVGCMGLCYCEPSIEIVNNKSEESVIYGFVKPEQVADILKATSLGKTSEKCKTVEKTWYYPDLSEKPDKGKFQARIALKNSGRIDPVNIDHYIANRGYFALGKALFEMKPEQIIETVSSSGLRGRGGGGFPTGLKWKFCRQEVVKRREQESTASGFIVCNADEGDPGAFMDRAILEGDPHSVIEGMVIAAIAIGANEGFIYIRTEYPLAIKRLKIAIADAKKLGLLGQNILGSGFNFELSIREGAGAFVCGEETALMNSIMGISPEPVQKPPFPAQSGLWGFPTNINNVETWANVPPILLNGPEWFAKIGTQKSPGTKVFSLVGKVKQTGLIEVPLGISMHEIIFNVGGGILNDRKLKAVQTGGPSGGCIPAEMVDIPVDYERLTEVGSIMGSGGMIVMDEDNCMVDVARYFLHFTSEESCGKCSSCRDGSIALLHILKRICEGNGREDDIPLLKELCAAIIDASLCGLGTTLPNPVLSTLRFYENEYREHIFNKKCPAGACVALISFNILADKCVGCQMCFKACPSSAITGELKQKHVIHQEKCIKCGACFQVCKFKAVEKK